MPESVRFNRFNKGTEDFVTPGLQLEYVADAKPDGTAIVEIDKQGKEIKISWDGLRKLSNRIAWLLIDKGIDSDSTVIATWPNNILHVAAMLAIWKCGACYVPIPSKTTIAELDGVLDTLHPKLLLTDLELDEDADAISGARLEELSAGFAETLPPDVVSNPNIITLSGGSTGRPKLIRQNLAAGHTDDTLRGWCEMIGMGFEMMQMLLGPIFHGAPHSCLMNGLFMGNTIIMPHNLCPDSIIKLIKEFGVEYMQMVPTLMHRIVKEPGVSAADFATIKAFSHTGGVCSEWLKREWFKLIPPERVYEMYSQTEVIGLCCIRGDQWLKHPGSVGRPVGGGKISIRDENGHEVPTGTVGEIFMTPPADFFYTEYINAPPIELMPDGYRSVGDMGYVDEDGYLYFSDRRSDIIVTGGENVFAVEVENAIMQYPNVLDAVVVGLPDPEWGRRIHAVIESREKIDIADLKSFLKTRLTPYKIPKTYELVPSIRHEGNGKIQRMRIMKECIARGV